MADDLPFQATIADATGPDHIGLAYEAWSRRAATDPERADGLERLSRIPVSADYGAGCYERWLESLCQDGSRAAQMTLASRLWIGSGPSSASGGGLTLHHTWGVPLIPGRALKGLLAHYLAATYGPSVPPADPEREEEQARRPYQGITWVGEQILHGPGVVHRALFGAPPVRPDRDLSAASGATQGCVLFQDALYVPGSAVGDRPFVREVATVHQGDYYGSAGQTLPNDYDRPQVVESLSVRPGTRFLLALSGPSEWTAFALQHLKVALQEWGVGGKTASGYGLAEPTGWRDIIDPAQTAIRRHPVVVSFEAWLHRHQSLPDPEKLAAISQEWVPTLRQLPLEVRRYAVGQAGQAIHAPRLRRMLLARERGRIQGAKRRGDR